MGGWANQLQTLPQGLVLTSDVDPDPELDNYEIKQDLRLMDKDFRFHIIYVVVVTPLLAYFPPSIMFSCLDSSEFNPRLSTS